VAGLEAEVTEWLLKERLALGKELAGSAHPFAVTEARVLPKAGFQMGSPIETPEDLMSEVLTQLYGPEPASWEWWFDKGDAA